MHQVHRDQSAFRRRGSVIDQGGADFPRWILELLAGQKPDIEFGRFKNNLTMLRYDSEVWIDPQP